MLIPSGGGKFELSVDGIQIWSKKQAKRFPEYSEVTDAMPKREPAAATGA